MASFMVPSTPRLDLTLRFLDGPDISLKGDCEQVSLTHDEITDSVPFAMSKLITIAAHFPHPFGAQRDCPVASAVGLALAVLQGDVQAALMLADKVLESYHADRKKG